MFALILIAIVFAPLAFAAVEPWAYLPLYSLFFFGAASVYSKGKNTHSVPIYKSLIPAVLGIVVIGVLQSFTQAPINGPSHLLFTTWRPATLNTVITWLFYAAVMYTTSKTINSTRQLFVMLWVVLSVGVVLSLMGMGQKSSGERLLIYGIREVGGVPFASFVNRNHAALFLSMSALCGLGLFFGGLKRLIDERNVRSLFDLIPSLFLKLIMLVTVVVGIFKTGSRAGLISFAIAAILMSGVMLGYFKWKVRGIVFVVSFVCAMGIFAVMRSGRLNAFIPKISWAEDSVVLRREMYKSSLRMIDDYRFFGSGLGTVENSFPYYAGAGITSIARGRVSHVHSDWLEMIVEVGVVGAGVYFVGLIFAMVLFYRNLRNSASFGVSAISGGMLGGVLVVVFHGFVDFGLQMPANAMLFYCFLGALSSRAIIGGDRVSYAEHEDGLASLPPRKIYGNIAKILAAMLLVASLPQFISWRYSRLANVSEFSDAVGYFKKSLRWAPAPQAAFRLGAEYYNHALTHKDGACRLFKESQRAIWSFLRQSPLNGDLNKLEKHLGLQLDNCYNRKLEVKGKKPVLSSMPTGGSSLP